MAKGNLIHKLFASGPLFLLYYLSVSEVDTNLEKLFNNEKKSKLANNKAIKKVNQSDAIVVLTLLFLT